MRYSTCTICHFPFNNHADATGLLIVSVFFRRVNEDSILAIQIFDQKKFKKKDQGFLGVINVRIGDVIDMQMGGDGESDILMLLSSLVVCYVTELTSWFLPSW